MKIADILRYKGTEVVTIGPDDSLRALVLALGKHNVGALIVVEDGAVVGVASERDVVRKMNIAQHGLLDAHVRDIMSTDLITATSEDDIDAIADTMTEKRIRHLPVIDAGQLVGIVTIGDVVLHRSRQLEQQRRDLEQYISG